MQEKKINDAALALRNARASRRTIGQLCVTHGIGSIDEAYAISEVNRLLKMEQGHRVIGKKIGLTSKSVQAQLGVDQPDFGILFDDMEYLNGQDVPANRLIQPKVEAEIAFVMSHSLTDRQPSYGEFLAALGFALPALEIVDSAITDWKITLIDTVADNASAALYVLGDQPVPMANLALGELGMMLEKNGSVVSTGVGAACLGHPLRAAYWLACEMINRGHGLQAGEIILSGALGPMVPIAAGDHVRVRIQGLGTAHFHLAADTHD